MIMTQETIADAGGEILGCPDCDLLLEASDVSPHCIAACPRCGAVLSKGRGHRGSLGLLAQSNKLLADPSKAKPLPNLYLPIRGGAISLSESKACEASAPIGQR